MIIIDVTKERSIEAALKKFRRKFKKYEVRKDLVKNKEFEKKSVTKRKQKIKAQYVQSLKDQEQND